MGRFYVADTKLSRSAQLQLDLDAVRGTIQRYETLRFWMVFLFLSSIALVIGGGILGGIGLFSTGVVVSTVVPGEFGILGSVISLIAFRDMFFEDGADPYDDERRLEAYYHDAINQEYAKK